MCRRVDVQGVLFFSLGEWVCGFMGLWAYVGGFGVYICGCVSGNLGVWVCVVCEWVCVWVSGWVWVHSYIGVWMHGCELLGEGHYKPRHSFTTQ